MQSYSKLANLSKLGRCTSERSVQIVRPRVHGARRRLGHETVARLVADYQAGSPTSVLMENYHIGKGTVLGILHEAGVIRRQRRASEVQMQQAADLYAQGWSLAQIGEHFGFEDSTVWLWLKKLGVPRRQPWERHP